MKARFSHQLLQLREKSPTSRSNLPKVISVLGLCGCLAGCTVGPDYKRPAVNAPDEFRRAASDTNAASTTESLADLGWWEVFKDPQLTAYIAEALTNSWDIRIAAARVLQAEANLKVVRSQWFPSISAGGDLITSRFSRKGATNFPSGSAERNYGDVFLSMNSYEIDLWGKIRRANEAARAQLLANKEAQRTVRQTLVAAIANAYLDLLTFDLELDIAQRTYLVRTNSLDLTRSRESGGVAGMQDVYQAQILVHTAEASIADTHRLIEIQENQLCILLGRNPGRIARGMGLNSEVMSVSVPAGLPSSLLDRRPDIKAAEQQLVAANANIGQAKAAFYPSISLTGIYGHQSVALSDLFTGATRAWQFGPSVTLPLFTGGRLRGNLNVAKAQFTESLLSYQQRVQDAFKEVSDALISYQRTQEFRDKQAQRTQSHRGATEMANTRYEGGVTSYLEVLYNEQELFNAELNLAQARRNELESVVELYRSLGGGWTESATQTISKN